MSFIFSLINERTNVACSPFWLILERIVKSSFPFPKFLSEISKNKITEAIEHVNRQEGEPDRNDTILAFLKRLQKEEECFKNSFSGNFLFEKASKEFLDSCGSQESLEIKHALFGGEINCKPTFSKRVSAPKSSIAFTFPSEKKRSVRTSTVFFNHNECEENQKEENESFEPIEIVEAQNEETEKDIFSTDFENYEDSNDKAEIDDSSPFLGITEIAEDNSETWNSSMKLRNFEDESIKEDLEIAEEEEEEYEQGAPFFDTPAAVCAAGIAYLSETFKRDLRDFCLSMKEIVEQAKREIVEAADAEMYEQITIKRDRNCRTFIEHNKRVINELDKLGKRLDACAEEINSIDTNFIQTKNALQSKFRSDLVSLRKCI